MAGQQTSGKKDFQLSSDYIDVAARLADFHAKYPEGRLQQHSLEFREFAGQMWVIYTAAAYRTPDDPRPAMGTAWEKVPGATPYTKDSELQNAETAAWGRAIVASGASTSKKIASAEEVRNRGVEQGPPPIPDGFEARVETATNEVVLSDLWQEAVHGGFGQQLFQLFQRKGRELKAIAAEADVPGLRMGGGTTL